MQTEGWKFSPLVAQLKGPLSGCLKRIDHRSLKEQGISRQPEKHLGPAAHAMMQRGELPNRALLFILKKLREQLKRVQAEIHRAVLELKVAQRRKNLAVQPKGQRLGKKY